MERENLVLILGKTKALKFVGKNILGTFGGKLKSRTLFWQETKKNN